ncbi:MAG: VanZ family protein [bacterium]|nr:VanZ family protein [bacterium]
MLHKNKFGDLLRFFCYHWLLPIAWAGMIFCFSSIPSLESGFAVSVDWTLRKIAHAGVYAMLAFLLFRALRDGQRMDTKKALLWASALALGYAFSDEFHQLYVPGRHGRLRDVGIDTIGIIGSWLLLRRK